MAVHLILQAANEICLPKQGKPTVSRLESQFLLPVVNASRSFCYVMCTSFLTQLLAPVLINVNTPPLGWENNRQNVT